MVLPSSRCRHNRVGAVADVAEPALHRVQPQRHDAAVAVEDGLGRRRVRKCRSKEYRGRRPGAAAPRPRPRINRCLSPIRETRASVSGSCRSGSARAGIGPRPSRPPPETAPAPCSRSRSACRARRRAFFRSSAFRLLRTSVENGEIRYALCLHRNFSRERRRFFGQAEVGARAVIQIVRALVTPDDGRTRRKGGTASHSSQSTPTPGHGSTDSIRYQTARA